MFRKMRRHKQELSKEECMEILTNNDYPYALPMSHAYVDGKIYFHGAMEGHKNDAVKRYDKVSYCVMDKGFRNDGVWWYTFKSVIVFGKLIPVQDQELAMKLCRDLCYKFTQDQDYIEHEIQSSGKKYHHN